MSNQIYYTEAKVQYKYSPPRRYHIVLCREYHGELTCCECFSCPRVAVEDHVKTLSLFLEEIVVASPLHILQVAKQQ